MASGRSNAWQLLSSGTGGTLLLLGRLSLTPALSRWERERPPPLAKSSADGRTLGTLGQFKADESGSLSQRERARVRENGTEPGVVVHLSTARNDILMFELPEAGRALAGSKDDL